MAKKTSGATLGKMCGKIAKEYLKRFPNTPSLTLAKKMYSENKETFKDIDDARKKIRYYRGQQGEAKRKSLATKEFLKDSGSRNPFEFLPDSHADTFEPFIISQSRVLNISDLHFPYQHNDAIKKALQYGIENDANCILINGDLIDFAGISRHEKDWRQRSIKVELDSVKSFLKGLRGLFPDARIVWKYGNHDERWEKYLFLKAPELFDTDEFQLEVIFKLAELGIEVVKDKRPVRIGKLTVLHGHELAGGSGGVNPARATFLKTLDSVIVGHYHKTSQHTETTMLGDVISVESQGCLCGMTPYYMTINKWNLGFSFIEHDLKSGEYHLHNKKIIKGKVY